MAGKGASLKGPSVGRIMANIERAIIDERADAVRKAAMAAKNIHAREIDQASGGDGMLSGVMRAGSARRGVGDTSGARVGVRYHLEGKGWQPEAFFKATGPLQLIERDTDPHVIRSTHLSGRGRRGLIGPTLPSTFKLKKVTGPTLSPVLNIPGIGYRRSARHPGTSGRHPWEKGKRKAEPVIHGIMRKSMFTTIKRAARP
jgi:hypothetical protein